MRTWFMAMTSQRLRTLKTVFAGAVEALAMMTAQ
jgi:hypothetical protein